MTKPIIESSQKPYSIVSRTILQATIGTKSGFLEMAYKPTVLKNRMVCSLDLSVILGRSLTWPTDMLAKVVCITASSLKTRVLSGSSGNFSPSVDRTERHLSIASVNFEDAASSFERRPLAVKLSSKDWVWEKISLRRCCISEMSPFKQLTEADIS